MFYKRLILITLVAFTILLLFHASCSNQSLGNSPEAVEGILDLTQSQLDEEVIRLDGQWEFYWNQLLEPAELKETSMRWSGYINLPASWNGYQIQDQKLPGDGYATYRLKFKTADNSRLAVKIPRIFTSYNLWINEELVASAGTVGKSRDTTIPQYLPQVAFFEAQQDDNEIVIQVANFYHRSGGILESLLLGNEKQILSLHYKRIAYELFLFGSLIIIGAYHLALFLFRKKDYSLLFFGLFSILVGIRTLLVGERFLIFLFPAFNWEVAHKLQTLIFYLGLPLILMFFKAIFPHDISQKIVRAVQVVALGFGGLVLLTPAKTFSVANPAYQLFALIVITYIVYILVKVIPRKETGTGFIVVGALILILTTVNDIIFLSVWMSDYSTPLLRSIIRSGNQSSFGQLVFIFTHSLALAQKFSLALEKEEVMTEQLQEINANLDTLVQKRTYALEKSRKKIQHQKNELEKSNQILQMLSLKDPLTGLWNRRHFDESIKIEWNHGLKHKKPVSLIIIDIDHFKEYNDFYGHKAGDECLIQVALAIRASCKRVSDTVARYGGEEFVVIMTEVRKNEALEMANILRKNIEELKIPHNHSSVNACVTVSIGVASIVPKINAFPNDLFLTADQALYEAKSQGRNQVSSK
ncbi:MAG: histidine kinase [Gracilibacter sp. BRH_c7a]|nr:MAG: histidine kinase [Gracilibacter sp. BRH_c7a]